MGYVSQCYDDNTENAEKIGKGIAEREERNVVWKKHLICLLTVLI